MASEQGSSRYVESQDYSESQTEDRPVSITRSELEELIGSAVRREIATQQEGAVQPLSGGGKWTGGRMLA